jgi:hypothetical protein
VGSLFDILTFARMSLITHVINVHLVRLEGAPGYRVFRVRFNGYRKFYEHDEV